jgi:hypothetical protein
MKYVRLELVMNDTPNIELGLVNKKTGLPPDLSDSLTVARLKTRPLFGASPSTTTTVCSKLTGREVPGGIDTTPPYDVVGKGGRVLAACAASVFPAAGEYDGELEVTFGATTQIATPFAKLRITVRADL